MGVGPYLLNKDITMDAPAEECLQAMPGVIQSHKHNTVLSLEPLNPNPGGPFLELIPKLFTTPRTFKSESICPSHFGCDIPVRLVPSARKKSWNVPLGSE